jgi:hypothetical protein
LKRALPLIAVLGAALGPACAHAGEIACRFEQGVVVVPASVAGAAGDYLLDTGTAMTALHETRAEGEGFEGTMLVGEVKLAGITLRERVVGVANLDARTYALPTPIAGVIGADVLRGHVLDVQFSPCRVGFYPAGRAPRLRGGLRLPMAWGGDLPVVEAVISDGAQTLEGTFAPATGLPLHLRLDLRFASAPQAGKPDEMLPGGVGIGRLKSLTFAGETFADASTALLPAGAGEAPVGLIGAPVLSRRRLRFDLENGVLVLSEP